MKKILSYFMMAIAMLSLYSCSPKHNKTIANLKAAIDGEATASAKYAAFSEQAAKDSLFNVVALFQATSQAEAIHVKNHQAALTKLGVTDYQPNVTSFDIKSTIENLQTAIKGETYEFTEMYPQFIKDAEAEKVEEALISFNYAQDAEKGHAKIYNDVLSKISTPSKMAVDYYVCPKCGNTYAGTPSKECEICRLSADKFMLFNANIPTELVDGRTGATTHVDDDF